MNSALFIRDHLLPEPLFDGLKHLVFPVPRFHRPRFPCGDTIGHCSVHLFKLFRESLKCKFPVPAPIPVFSGDNGGARRLMPEPHAVHVFVAVLSAGAAAAVVLNNALLFKGLHVATVSHNVQMYPSSSPSRTTCSQGEIIINGKGEPVEQVTVISGIMFSVKVHVNIAYAQGVSS